jgi:hypothetical protein
MRTLPTVMAFVLGVAFIARAIAVPPSPPPAPTTHLDGVNGFRVTVPAGWGDSQLVGRIVWHVAAQGGSALPDCSVIVTADAAFALQTVDQFIASQTREQMLQLLAISFKDPRIVLWEPNFQLGGQRALLVIYTGELDGSKQATMVMQTTRVGRLYTFSCNAAADQFPIHYADLLHVADSFEFVTIPPPSRTNKRQ